MCENSTAKETSVEVRFDEVRFVICTVVNEAGRLTCAGVTVRRQSIAAMARAPEASDKVVTATVSADAFHLQTLVHIYVPSTNYTVVAVNLLLRRFCNLKKH